MERHSLNRYAWKINKLRAERSEVILSTVQGLIVGAFVADRWLEAISSNFPSHNPLEGRFGFEGKEAPVDITDLYLRKRVPDRYRRRGAANPVKYTY